MIKIKKFFNKNHQLYLLISFFVFIFLITFFSLNFPKKEPVISLITPTPTLRPTATPMPTVVKGTPQPLKNIDATYIIGTRTLEVKYNPKDKRTFLYLKENGQNILIKSYSDFPCSVGETCRNIPMKFSISSDNNYLVYNVVSEWEGSMSDFYYIPDKKVTNLPIPVDESGFSKNNQYFYACGLGGFDDGGVYIYHLPKMELVYQDKNNSARCQYNSSNNSLKISYTDYNEPFFTNTVYYFDTNKAVSQ